MFRHRFLQTVCFFGALTAIAQAAPTNHLSKEALEKAIAVSAFSIPSPGELLVALDKTDKPTWQSMYRPPIPASYSCRAQSAFNLGGLIADAYLAVEAQDAQQIKNSGRDIVALAKTLGISEQILRRDNSINDFANSGSWATLYEELDAITDEIKTALDDQSDHDLSQLIQLGAWVRTTDALVAWTALHYRAANAQVLTQPAVASDLLKALSTIREKKSDSAFLTSINNQLPEISKVFAAANHQPLEQPQVVSLHEIFQKILAQATHAKM